MLLTQSNYAKDLLVKIGMDTSRPSTTPMSTNCIPLAYEGKPYPNPKHYKSIVGSLQYLL